MSKWFNKCNEVFSTLEKSNLEVQEKIKIFINKVKENIHGLELVKKDELLKKLNDILLEVFGENHKLFIAEDENYPYMDLVLEIDDSNILKFEFSKGTKGYDNTEIHYVRSDSYNYKLHNKELNEFDNKVCKYIKKEMVDTILNILSKQKFEGRFSDEYSKLELNVLSKSSSSNEYNNNFSFYLPDKNKNNSEIKYEEFYKKLIKLKNINIALDSYEDVIDTSSKLADFFDELNIYYSSEKVTYNWNEYYI